jgi:hypothetical protein
MSTPKPTEAQAAHAHRFVEQYDGLVGFGLDRKTDENTLVYYLQKVSDDALAKTLVERMSDEELEQLFSLLNRLMKRHLKDGEYHRLFLKEDHL